MLDLIKRRERMRILMVIALALGSASAVVTGTFAAFIYSAQPYAEAASHRFA